MDVCLGILMAAYILYGIYWFGSLLLMRRKLKKEGLAIVWDIAISKWITLSMKLLGTVLVFEIIIGLVIFGTMGIITWIS